MERIATLVMLCLSILSLSGCMSGFSLSLSVPVETLDQPAYRTFNNQTGNPVQVSDRSRQQAQLQSSYDEEFVYQQLISQYHDWKGVPYKYGGMSKNGIDCSGFIFSTFKSRLGVNVPRSTELLSESGAHVSRKNLRTGDIVFFSTGTKQRHAGIYLGEGKFLHASTSQGVTISNLSNVYWTNAFWKAVRIPI